LVLGNYFKSNKNISLYFLMTICVCVSGIGPSSEKPIVCAAVLMIVILKIPSK
jgi:hypothetical protein